MKRVDDLEHRRFSTTLHPNQIVTAFKKCIHKKEVSKKSLMTCYRVVLAALLRDDTLTDDEFIKLYLKIQPRANEVYERRAKRLRRIKV
jgi:hypothetical protein